MHIEEDEIKVEKELEPNPDKNLIASIVVGCQSGKDSVLFCFQQISFTCVTVRVLETGDVQQVYLTRYFSEFVYLTFYEEFKH